ncbi:hypothetical protein BKD30_12445 [Tersicoccus phoenicis]|uniref:Uncharacterized protein n=1 Tax=Tersicoccus phoenicis TaxID=554083 RepID=A0A1R1L7D5_9MICC|nr:hypothetical protein [Tersicoccus phoenicis]OMH23433.1 hypothetical protein BKD30_12445 [Tersicoccus phoenicis]
MRVTVRCASDSVLTHRGAQLRESGLPQLASTPRQQQFTPHRDEPVAIQDGHLVNNGSLRHGHPVGQADAALLVQVDRAATGRPQHRVRQLDDAARRTPQLVQALGNLVGLHVAEEHATLGRCRAAFTSVQQLDPCGVDDVRQPGAGVRDGQLCHVDIKEPSSDVYNSAVETLHHLGQQASHAVPDPSTPARSS